MNVSMPGYHGGMARQRLLFADGSARDGIPFEGLVALDQDRAANAASWGRWSAGSGGSWAGA